MKIRLLFGLLCAVVGGLLAGIGLTSAYDLPMWWWMLGLLFICVGALFIMFEDDKK